MKHSQKGSVKVWLIVTGIIMVVIGGYVLSVQNKKVVAVQPKSVATETKILNCGAYVTPTVIANTLGLTGRVVVTTETKVATSCRISWIVPPVNPLVKSITKGSALFVLSSTVDTNAMLTALCKNKFISEGASCYTDKTPTSNNGITFKKNNVLIQITQTSAQAVTYQQLSTLAQTIASKL